MIDQELVLRLELLLVDVVVEPHREFAFVQGMAGVSLNVSRKGSQVRVREGDRQVELQVLGQRIDFARNGKRRGGVHLAAESDSGRALLLRRQSLDRAAKLLHVKSTVRLNRLVGEMERGVLQRERAKLNRELVCFRGRRSLRR